MPLVVVPRKHRVIGGLYIAYIGNLGIDVGHSAPSLKLFAFQHERPRSSDTFLRTGICGVRCSGGAVSLQKGMFYYRDSHSYRPDPVVGTNAPRPQANTCGSIRMLIPKQCAILSYLFG